MSAPTPIELDLPGARVAFSTRQGGVSDGSYRSLNLGLMTDDEPARVSENHRRLAVAAGLAPGSVAVGWQVHGAELAEWHGPPRADGPPGADAPLAQVDGHLTDRPDLGLLVLGADCMPVALAAPGRVAMLHCGWRGLAADIVAAAVARFDEAPAAALGPAIGRCCYEVGPEVLAEFEDLDGVADGRMLDLRAVARQKLAAVGVERIEDVGLCTSCREDLFFSHRRDAGVTGRQAGIVWRTG
jgi:YfiH family protein